MTSTVIFRLRRWSPGRYALVRGLCLFLSLSAKISMASNTVPDDAEYGDSIVSQVIAEGVPIWREQLKNIGVVDRRMEAHRTISLYGRDGKETLVSDWEFQEYPAKMCRRVLVDKERQATSVICQNGRYAFDIVARDGRPYRVNAIDKPAAFLNLMGSCSWLDSDLIIAGATIVDLFTSPSFRIISGTASKENGAVEFVVHQLSSNASSKIPLRIYRLKVLPSEKWRLLASEVDDTGGYKITQEFSGASPLHTVRTKFYLTSRSASTLSWEEEANVSQLSPLPYDERIFRLPHYGLSEASTDFLTRFSSRYSSEQLHFAWWLGGQRNGRPLDLRE